MHTVICDLQCSSRRIAELSIFEHDRLGLRDMSHFLELLFSLMQLRTYDHMFCSTLPFCTTYELFIGEVEERVKHKEFLELEESLVPREQRIFK